MSPSGLYRDNEDDILHTSHRLHRLLLPVLVYARCADYIKALLYIVSCRHCGDASLCSNSGASSMQRSASRHASLRCICRFSIPSRQTGAQPALNNRQTKLAGDNCMVVTANSALSSSRTMCSYECRARRQMRCRLFG